MRTLLCQVCERPQGASGSAHGPEGVRAIFGPDFCPNEGATRPSEVQKGGGEWAGANSNRGYGHPKAEGYQATPPARSRTHGHAHVNLSVLPSRGEIDRNDGEHDARTLPERQRLVEKEDR
jgi:hypothetical protein